MRRVFLSFDDDTADYAQRLREGLIETFGADCVVDTLMDADAVLAFLGPGSLPEPELEDALARGLPIALLLVGGATYPVEDDLPEPLRPLAHTNALEIPEPAAELDGEAVARQLTELVHPRAVAGNGGGAGASPPPTGAGMGAESPVTVGPPPARASVPPRRASRTPQPRRRRRHRRRTRSRRAITPRRAGRVADSFGSRSRSRSSAPASSSRRSGSSGGSSPTPRSRLRATRSSARSSRPRP